MKQRKQGTSIILALFLHVLLLHVLLLLPACVAPHGTRNSPLPEDLAAGQIWRYKTRPKESPSRLTIKKLEPHGVHGQVAHVHIDGLRFELRAPRSDYNDEVNMIVAVRWLCESLVARDREQEEEQEQEARKTKPSPAPNSWSTVLPLTPENVTTSPIAKALDRAEARKIHLFLLTWYQ